MLIGGVNVITLFHTEFSSPLTRKKASRNIEVNSTEKISLGNPSRDHPRKYSPGVCQEH